MAEKEKKSEITVKQGDILLCGDWHRSSEEFNIYAVVTGTWENGVNLERFQREGGLHLDSKHPKSFTYEMLEDAGYRRLSDLTLPKAVLKVAELWNNLFDTLKTGRDTMHWFTNEERARLENVQIMVGDWLRATVDTICTQLNNREKKEMIDLTKFSFAGSCPLNKNGEPNDLLAKDELVGYRVFYACDGDYMQTLHRLFPDIPNNEWAQVDGGEIEFTVWTNTEPWEIDGEVLLHYSIDNENLDFIEYNGDITPLVEDFKSAVLNNKTKEGDAR